VTRRSPVSVEILGAGAAAMAAARVLAHHAIPASIFTAAMRPGPQLLLNQATLQLIEDLFGCNMALLRQGTVIRGRLVRWDAAAADPELVLSPGLSVSSTGLYQVLLKALRSRAAKGLIRFTKEPLSSTKAAWTVDARGRNVSPRQALPIGKRIAISCNVRLSAEADPSLCAIEAVKHGWLFLLPCDDKRAVVQAFVPSPSECGGQGVPLADSRLVGRLIAAIEGEPSVLPCAPQLRPKLAAPAWLAAGDAALCFDPLCGDGVGQGLRSGLLAAAVIAAIERGREPQHACLSHYEYRLRRAMLAHLRAAVMFYQSASPDVWRDEIASANQAIGRIAYGELAGGSPGGVKYRLEGLSLVCARSSTPLSLQKLRKK
jgi:2-polyprenyl-6-methoxyphenol hydroxylase-like FAD-dependent oxidoreductase